MQRLMIVLVLVGTIATTSHAQEWTRFRGPNGQGISDTKTIPTKFTANDYKWKQKLPGEGHGSPSLWGDKLFVISADKKSATRSVICLDAQSGKPVWETTLESNTHHLHQFNHYGTCTPAVDAESVYVYAGSDKNTRVIALDHDGKERWTADLGTFDGNHGPSTSPMLYKDMVIVTHDQIAKGGVMALNKADGKQRWRLDRKGADNGTSYGVPVVYTDASGQDQLIVASKANGVTAINPSNGKKIWELNDLMILRSVAGPVLGDNILFAQCGSGGGGKRFVAVEPGSAGNKATLKWESKRGIPYVPTPIVYDGHLYYITDGGHAACLNPSDGTVLWQERIGDRLGFFGSPVCVNGHIYSMSKDGRCVVIKASPKKFELVSINNLGETSYATPAVANGRMYLRTLTHLICIGK